ncbi:MAG: MBL fold hydrolase [Candidatus Nitrosocaldaceae archaeon]|nr:MAG: MBL fold hydrolase [Candidatus Nitrosocaldaceae archaeon]
MILEQILVGHMANFTYILADGNKAIVIDPSWDLEKVLNLLKKHNLTLVYIINTHSHFDHTLGNEQLKALTNAKIAMHKNSPLEKDIELDEGSVIRLNDTEIKVLYTPGHTKDSICLLTDKILFTGDTLFVGNCGRTDLPGGDAGELYDSLQRLAKLDDDITIYPGHDYGIKPYSTIGEEKRNSMVFKPKSREEFIAFMKMGD